MNRATVRTGAVVEFAAARDAQRIIAGVPALARIARELAVAGFADLWVDVASGEAIDPAAWADVRRVAGDIAIHPGPPPAGAHAAHFPGDRLIAAPAIADFLAGRPHASIRLDQPRAAAEILRGTGKPGDGVVSRTLNRPISRRVSAFLLRFPAVRPVHATIGTAAIAAAMFAALVFGGRAGLLAGALLFHAASVFDGVDGEMARATFRATRKGAALDSAVDATTNIAAMLGLAVNLHRQGEPEALALAAWGLGLFLLGLAMIGRHSLRAKGIVSFDGVKQRYRGRFSGPLASRLMRLATLGTSRDFCALVYLLFVLAGIPMAGLYLFAAVTPVWIAFVAAALWRDGATAATEPAE
jgi:CDP-L-myo-inositol myo-inositolphosphotransferase